MQLPTIHPYPVTFSLKETSPRLKIVVAPRQTSCPREGGVLNLSRVGPVNKYQNIRADNGPNILSPYDITSKGLLCSLFLADQKKTWGVKLYSLQPFSSIIGRSLPIPQDMVKNIEVFC